MKAPQYGIESLLALILTKRPALDGAACAGNHTLFDAAEPDEDLELVAYRHKAAESICRSCPALPDCRSWAEHEPMNGRVLAQKAPRPPRRIRAEEPREESAEQAS